MTRTASVAARLKLCLVGIFAELALIKYVFSLTVVTISMS